MPRTIVGLLAATLVTTAVLAGQDPLYTLKVDVPLVTLDVIATDAYGKTVDTLAATDFEIYENGVRQEIRYFGPVSAPYNVLLLFDRSGSTQNKWPLMQRAVAGFIANLRPQDRLAIDGFDSDLVSLVKWGDGRERALAALAVLMQSKTGGSTEFYRAIETSATREFKGVSGRRAIVALTDGRDSGTYKEVVNRNRIVDSTRDRAFQKTLKTVREQRVPLYFIAVNTDRNLEPNEPGGDEFRSLRMLYPRSEIPDLYLEQVRGRMEQLSAASGGRVLFPKQFDDVVPLFTQIGRELGTAYSLGYLASDKTGERSLRRIEVRTKDPALKLTQSRTGYER